ncbi:oxidoreductase [Alkaliphilus peptidifermentans]|uniref:Predicted dehydrogenase n=1 Tax=Alkaliphilus peptidifermentans DSM 18978 TaxID=1120976 RepID=A0A1G5FEC9_9FIRM|nr:oxidoreductase [Alkaliphilus peptidifermentans]SCY36998.1 Predicted dehydrogenase [Alkaliphilus peptidifermentans DSM 18978]
MSIKIKVGIIGFGMAGRVFHAPIIDSIEGLSISKIATKNPDVKNYIQNTYPDVEVVQEADDILQDAAIDLVVVATPNTTHVELARKSLLAGKHTVVEKPFTITSSEADQLIEMANKVGKLLTVHQNRRWDSDFLTVKNIIKGEILGNLVEYEAHFDRFRNIIKDGWREEATPGAGILYDLGSHLIDQALYLFGLPAEITADIRTQRREARVDDSFEITLSYDRLKVKLKAGMLVREALPKFILLGDKGSFIKYGLDVQETALKQGLSPINSENWGEEPEDIWGTINTEIKGMSVRGRIQSEKGDYRYFYKNVYDAILGEDKLIVTANEARNTIRIIELALESSRLKRTLPFSE